MISGTLLKREIKANYKILILILAVVTLYSSMIIAMFDPKLGDSLAAMAESMPQVFAAFGMMNPGSTMTEFIGNYLYGFLLIVLPLVLILLLSNRILARYLDRGSMSYLLATPNRRIKIAFTQAAFMVLSLLVFIIFLTALCILLSTGMFSGELDTGRFIMLNVGLFGLLLFLGGMCFCSCCIFNETKYSLGVGAGLSILFILIQMVSQVGDKFENLKYATPLTLFDPSGILAGSGGAYLSFGILYAAGILLFGIGIGIFCRRDLSI